MAPFPSSTVALMILALVQIKACTQTKTEEMGCTYSTLGISCPPGHQLQSYSSCGLWGIAKYRRCLGTICCAGFSGSGCKLPVCDGGCGHGTCTAPGKCTCTQGYTGAKCSHRLAPAPKLTVLSINFACRDVAPLAGCDNCKTRFDLMASAISGAPGFSGVANFTDVDVVIAQELGTSEHNFAQITAALSSRGFTHTTGAPAPTASDPHCANPPGPFFSLTAKKAFSALSGLQSGGLVTFSKHPIVKSARQNWCAHNLPAPAGYLSTLLDVGGVATLVVNVHLFPEYDFGIQAADVRTYQFSELSAYANAATAMLRATGSPFAVVLGGDFNEDAYGLTSTANGRRCERISVGAATKLASVSLDVHAACASGAIGVPTWSPSTNDLSARFTEGNKHEVLDYIVMHSSSSEAKPPAAPNSVATLKANAKWSGTFCDSSSLGTLGGTRRGEASALTDHNSVTATFRLPDAPADRATALFWTTNAFNMMLRPWVTSKGAQEASCGQTGALCASDSNCCEARVSWSGVEQHCDRTSFTCAACVPLGGSCGSTLLQIEGSPCCGDDDYSPGNGAHCEMTLSGPTCVRKFNRGHTCLYDTECQSRNCKTEYWLWWPTGRKCQ